MAGMESRPATWREVEALLKTGLAALHPAHRARYERMRVIPRRVPITSAPGEYVFVVAAHEGKVLYYADLEDGWELEPLNESGGITRLGHNKFELVHVMQQLFGSPDAPGAA
jgi:hypothetical protein